MKTKKKEYYEDIIKLLKELKSLQPNTEMGKHLSTVMSEFKDIWGVSDKDIFVSLTKYKAQLELFTPNEEFQDLEDLLEEEEEY